MDRRRYVPSAEGLEGRALLSMFGASSAKATAQTNLKDLPENFQQKELRIENLPYFLGTIQPNRYLPPATMTQIQNDLRALAGNLHAPGTQAANNFNLELRHAMPYDTLSPNTAKILNHAFTVVVTQSGADPVVVQSLSKAMNDLALTDSKSINPSQLARNDYALVMQTALAVGRPMPEPSSPVISPKDGKSVNNGTGGYTFNHLPTIVGNYVPGATTNGFVSVEIYETGGLKLGSGVVDSTGKYTVTSNVELADGKHTLWARAVDQLGHVSALSKPYTLKVSTKSTG